MKKWKFGVDNDKLIELVLSGKKTVTTSVYDENDLPIIGEETIICFDDGKDACVIRTIDYKIMKFNEMTEELAKLEGEGDLSLKYWKKVHYDFFKSNNSDFNDETLIVFEIFEVIKNLHSKNNQKNKIVSTLNYLTAVCFYIVSIINFLIKNNSMGIVYLCLGSTFMCLGSVWLNKDK